MRALNTSYKTPTDRAFCNFVLTLLILSLNPHTHREVFAFPSTSHSAIELVRTKKLPKSGFCFVAELRVERDLSREMTVFRLGASEGWVVELFIKNMSLYYLVNSVQYQ